MPYIHLRLDSRIEPYFFDWITHVRYSMFYFKSLCEADGTMPYIHLRLDSRIEPYIFDWITHVRYSMFNFKSLCEADGAHIVEINTAAEQAHLENLYEEGGILDFSLTVKAAPHECVIRTGQP